MIHKLSDASSTKNLTSKRIEFIIDQEYDIKAAFYMLSGADWEYRAKIMGIDYALAKKIYDSRDDDNSTARDEFIKIATQIYKINLPFIERSKNSYQNSWNEIMEDYSQITQELTVPWFYDSYTCVVTHFNRGLSNWNGNIIGRWWRENPDIQRRITAHEMLLAHYFSIHRNLYPDSGLEERQIWALAEIAAIALTGFEPKLMKFWPWDTRGYYIDHNYPQIVDLQKELEEPFVKRKNFKEYVEVGIETVKKYNIFDPHNRK